MLCPHSTNRERVALPAASTHVHVPHAPIRFQLALAALQLDLPDRARAYLDGKMLVHGEPETWARKRANGNAVDPMGCREDACARVGLPDTACDVPVTIDALEQPNGRHRNVPRAAISPAHQPHAVVHAWLAVAPPHIEARASAGD